MSLTIKELQDTINARLERFSGEKFDSRKGTAAMYHHWYMTEIAVVFAEKMVDYLTPVTWRVVADIDGPGEIKVSYQDVARVEVDAKHDKRYKGAGPGTIRSIRVSFREDMLDLTIAQARVFLLKEDREKRLAYYRGERERLSAELDAAANKIADLVAITIEEAAE